MSKCVNRTISPYYWENDMEILNYKKFYVKSYHRLKVLWSVRVPWWNLDTTMILFQLLIPKQSQREMYISSHYSTLHQPQNIYLKYHNTISEWLSFVFHFDKRYRLKISRNLSLYLIYTTWKVVLKCTNDLCPIIGYTKI